MSLPNDDEVKGTWDKAKGAVKENVGHAVGNPDLEAEGKADRASGNVQDAYGEAKRKTGDAINVVGDAIKR